MEKKIIQRDGKLIFKDWCDHHIYSTVDVLYYLSNSIGIDCVYDVQNTVTLKRNYFSKNYQINVANYAYPESKKNITNDIKHCNSILNEFIASLKKTEFEIDITQDIEQLKAQIE